MQTYHETDRIEPPNSRRVLSAQTGAVGSSQGASPGHAKSPRTRSALRLFTTRIVLNWEANTSSISCPSMVRHSTRSGTIRGIVCCASGSHWRYVLLPHVKRYPDSSTNAECLIPHVIDTICASESDLINVGAETVWTDSPRPI
jgi:hypothetical protein